MSTVKLFLVRRAGLKDLLEVAEMCHSLWPEASAEEHAQELAPLLDGKYPGTLPAVVLVAEEAEADTGIVGFVEVGLRSHADGCNPSHPVGYVEGWYVRSAYRRQWVGARLIAGAEGWAREQGCVEMASDTWVDQFDSQHAHEALGFEVVDRCVHYRKDL